MHGTQTRMPTTTRITRMEMYIDFNALPDDLNQGVVLRQGRVKRAGKSPQQFEDDEVQRLLSIEHVDKLVMQYVVAACHSKDVHKLERLFAFLIAPPDLNDCKLLVGSERRLPLGIAITENQPAMVDLLLSHGADPNAYDRLGAPAWHMALIYNNMQLARKMMKAGANAQLVNTRNGGNALHELFHSGTPEMITFMLQSHVDPDHKNFKGESARELINHTKSLTVEETMYRDSLKKAMDDSLPLVSALPKP